MAKNPENVKSFLETLSSQLQTLWKKEREVILKYKEEDFKAMGREFNGKINAEDFWYYITLIQEKEFSVDSALFSSLNITNKIGDKIPAESAKHILIATSVRSGSTFLGELIREGFI